MHISTHASDESVAAAVWPASLALTINGSDRGTVLKKSKHIGPLYVQKAFYPEGPDCAHIYLLHPPGGVVSGDTLEISAAMNNGAAALFTTPGAMRLYRARVDPNKSMSLPQRVNNILTIDESSLAEWLPGETIVFNGANIELSTAVQLDESSLFCGWEIICLGLPSSNQPFKAGRFTQTFSITLAGVPKLVDRLQFSAESEYLKSNCGLQAKHVYGSLIAGPFAKSCDEQVNALREMIELQGLEAECSVTTINEFVLLRYLGDLSDQARDVFIKAWTLLRPALCGRSAVEPRIWTT
ncbi:MAG: urease accessory protein UreD [Pseudomonadales bacterium]